MSTRIFTEMTATFTGATLVAPALASAAATAGARRLELTAATPKVARLTGTRGAKGSYACCFEECAGLSSAPSLALSSAPIPDKSDSKANLGIIVGSVIGVCCLLVAISPWVYFKMHKANCSVVVDGVEPPVEVEQAVESAVDFSTRNKFCGGCGVSLNAGNKYCTNCGSQIH